MQEHIFEVENIRCGGCAHTITSKLKAVAGVQDVDIDIDAQKVTIAADSTDEHGTRQALRKVLVKLGYPEVGSEEAKSLLTKASSFVSCAVGKVSAKS